MEVLAIVTSKEEQRVTDYQRRVSSPGFRSSLLRCRIDLEGVVEWIIDKCLVAVLRRTYSPTRYEDFVFVDVT